MPILLPFRVHPDNKELSATLETDHYLMTRETEGQGLLVFCLIRQFLVKLIYGFAAALMAMAVSYFRLRYLAENA